MLSGCGGLFFWSEIFGLMGRHVRLIKTRGVAKNSNAHPPPPKKRIAAPKSAHVLGLREGLNPELFVILLDCLLFP